MNYTPDEIIDLCMENLPLAKTAQDICNIRIAARLAWERKEMGGLEHVQFAYRNGTPIVPIGHCGHPLQLVERGYIDGKGWPKEETSWTEHLKLFRWPDGSHWYASWKQHTITDGEDQKWNTQQQAHKAAERFLKQRNLIP